MPAIILPSGTPLISAVPFRQSTVAEILRRLTGTSAPFTGYLALTGGDRVRLLFFFQSHPYAAGLVVGETPAALSITDFCAQAALLAEGTTTLSLHAADPVLLKCLLVFIQEEPTAKGPVDSVDLGRLLRQIHQEGTDALVIMERNGMFNLFFFKDGNKSVAYWSDAEFKPEELSVDEQMILYASQPSEKPVCTYIYRNLSTEESPDAAAMSLEGLIRLFSAGISEPPAGTAPAAQASDGPLTLRILEGPDAGVTLHADIPCVMGRKDADIIINDQMVSKRHAVIQNINGKLILMDLHSTNGTTLNGQPVSQQELAQGDKIGIGQTILEITAVRLT